MNPIVDGRQDIRFSAWGTVEIQTGPENTGFAQWENLSRDGACLRLAQPIWPDTHVLLILEGLWEEESPFVFKTRVIWCTPVQDTDEFRVGLRIYHDVAEVKSVLATVMDGMRAVESDLIVPGNYRGEEVFSC